MCLVGPVLGIILYYGLFRKLRVASGLTKIVATLGLSVAIPGLATILFGNETILQAPGLATHEHVYQVLGVPVTTNELIVYVFVIVIVLVGASVLRFTGVGLKVRAMVDSPAMTSLSGTDPRLISVGVWAASIFLAGVVGVLAAPIVGLDANSFTLLMTSAFAAVIAGKLRNLPVAVIVGLAIGVGGSVIPHYLPPNSTVTAAVIPSIPFAVTAVCLIYYMIRSSRVDDTVKVGGALDLALAVDGQSAQRPATSASLRPSLADLRSGNIAGPLAITMFVALLPLALHGFWIGQLALGVAYAVLFLANSLVVGEGGMVWLCVITFGGIGGLATGQLATQHGWPVLAAVVLGGVLAAPMGVLLGLLTIRLGELYVALVTLTFGLLMENLVFSQNTFQALGAGIGVNPPEFAQTNEGIFYLGLGVFVVIALFITNLRWSSTGLALTAIRCSEPGSKTIGISVVRMRLLVAGLAAFVAAIGGGLIAVQQGVALPANYSTLIGVLWLTVLVTNGIRSNVACLVAGCSLPLMQGVIQQYAPSWVPEIIPIIFGLGAIGLASNPEGLLVTQSRQISQLWGRTSLGARQRAELPGRPRSNLYRAEARTGVGE